MIISTTDTISPAAPPIIRMTPMAGRLTYFGCQLTANRRIAPIMISAVLPPMLMQIGTDQPGRAADHQDDPDGREIDVLRLPADRKSQNCADYDQRGAPADAHAAEHAAR